MHGSMHTKQSQKKPTQDMRALPFVYCVWFYQTCPPSRLDAIDRARSRCGRSPHTAHVRRHLKFWLRPRSLLHAAELARRHVSYIDEVDEAWGSDGAARDERESRETAEPPRAYVYRRGRCAGGGLTCAR